MSDPSQTHRRVVLKLSGESFAHAGERGISMDAVVHTAEQTAKAAERGVQIAIVIGGGNILRGAQFASASSKIQEATSHYMGMLATVINGLALQDALESLGCATRLSSAIRMDGVAEPYIRRRAAPPLGKRADRDPGLRHRQPLCDHRHGRRPAGFGTGRRHPAQGHPRRRRLQRRPREESARGSCIAN